jgi:mycofactocin precursor
MHGENTSTVLKTGNDINAPSREEPQIIEEIAVEELTIDGICGVY